MRATPVLQIKETRHGGIVEMIIWRLPEPVPPCTHPYKYRMVFVKNGRRIVGFDNERGKGDHRHLHGVESPYRFVDVQTLLADFWREVDTRGDPP
jgi:hypothetical protein